ncbi:MAG TPA: aminoglycoside phosphotransferase family protein [Clostridiales bacterium]|nr:MAG: N-acetylhexosamine 1-kinase [Firmicutes bacterium ADurb.Bin262]HOU11030.1 aminoglycoside phosphotransferase family protein [Clostridiales bacterium]HQH62736.1 aminoglycoside phosphotransferase family protein [Clostridiales bacterium]HQK73701.1 aminoglycoside phosphotransferase family protein [Clostridiales bacterium]
MDNAAFDIKEILSGFTFDGEYVGFELSNSGHINNTFILFFEQPGGGKTSYILQQINTHVFKQPEQLMENIVGITTYLAEKIRETGGDPERETLHVIPSVSGKSFYVDAEGRYWRCYNYVSSSYSCEKIDSPHVFYNAAKAFGRFQRMLADYPIDSLYETIPGFHNTVSRFEAFLEAVKTDAAGRAADASDEIAFVLERKNDAGVLLDLLARGELPLRVTHNDTKLNNVMFDCESREGICVIDLDTVMPGLSLYDFGDSIRFGANTASEDETDLSKVSLDLELYEQYTRGYLHAAGKALTYREVEYLPFSAKLMTLECGMRFLTDHLNGDHYFRIAYPGHNLVRCRTQFALVADIEKKMDRMQTITQRIYRELPA